MVTAGLEHNLLVRRACFSSSSSVFLVGRFSAGAGSKSKAPLRLAAPRGEIGATTAANPDELEL